MRSLSLFFILGLFGHPASAGPGPDPFLVQCGHAPIRFFEGALRVEAERSVRMQSKRSVQARLEKHEDQIFAESDRVDRRFLKARLYGEHLDFKIYPDLSQFARVRAVGPTSWVEFKRKQDYPVELEGLDHPSQDYVVENNERFSEHPKLRVWVHNEDTQLAALVKALPVGMRLKTENLTCPLPEAAQGDACAKEAFPFDPGRLDGRIMRRIGTRALRPQEGLEEETLLFKRLVRRHDARGFAYAIQYENPSGFLHPAKFTTRYTANPYTMFELLTRSPCPGWRIKRIAINAHQRPTGLMYAYRFDETTNQLVRGRFFTARMLRERTSDILYAYAEGATIELLACNTLTGLPDSQTPKDLRVNGAAEKKDRGRGIGDFFTTLTTPMNPIREVIGYNGICTPIFPTATTPALGDRKVWRNPLH